VNNTPNTAVILVNYNGYEDTIECINSLLLSDYKNFTIFLTDNNSTNNSKQELLNFFNSEKLNYLLVDNNYSKNNKQELKSNIQIVFISSNKNLGFGGGNNLAIKVAKSLKDFDFYWLLNTDTKVFKNSLSLLVKEMSLNANFGFLSSVLLYYSNPNTIQSFGVKFYPILGMARHLHNRKNTDFIKKLPKSIYKCNLVPATALLTTKEVLKQINGFDDKNFFMYGEDTDLVLRGQKKGFKAGVVKDSFVLHKKNASTSHNRNSYYQMLYKSHMVLIKKHYNILFCFTALIPICIITIIQTRSLTKTFYALKGWFQGITYKEKQ